MRWAESDNISLPFQNVAFTINIKQRKKVRYLFLVECVNCVKLDEYKI
jgi:hypothetical protein